MELQFEKIGKKWVAEFEATGNFNLNIERVAPEKIQVFQKGAEDGEYASQASWYNNYASAIVDYDFSALIYPKWIKVVSYSEPVQAIVTMEGESGTIVDNPDDYEQEVLIEVVDYNDKVVASHVFNRIPKDDENDISEYTSLANKAMPAKSVLVTYRYIKDDVAIAFIPKNVKIFIGHYYEKYDNEFFAQIPAQLTIENNTIILNWGDILKDCYVESGNDTRLRFSLKGEEAEIPFLIN